MLKQTLKTMFDGNREKCEEMMKQECHYETNIPGKRYDNNAKEYVPTGTTYDIDTGFAKELGASAITWKVEAEFGGEGQGDSYWTVYRFDKDSETVYTEFYGSYASYDGSYYDGWKFVTPAEKTITVWM